MYIKHLIVTLFLLALSFVSSAKVHEIKMLNKNSSGEKMVFEPSFLKIKVGDSVKFIPTKKGHMVRSITKKGAIPAGAKKFKSKMNKEITVKIEKEGVYLYKCTPHYAMGMVGLFIAGKPTNLSKVKTVKLRGKAKKRMDKLLAKVK